MDRLISATIAGLLAAGTLTVLAGEPAKTPAPSRPNIIFILADDYGLDGVSCYGSDRFRGKTPNLDRLAAGGIRFERCYSTPLCGPSRCQLMTGRYPFRTGGLTNPTAGRPSPTDELCIAKLLKQSGYATGHAGKWRQMGGTPGEWGFDEYLTDQTAGGHYWNTQYTVNGKLQEFDHEVYCPDAVHRLVLDFVRKHREGPFFCYYATHLVHGPILRTPDTKPGTTDNVALYNDNVAYLDKQVGELMAELDRLGIRERTLVVFTGDNGTARQSGTLGGRQINGHKGTLLEGGSRVPLIASWKGNTPAGVVNKDLIDFSDMFATFAELAGAKLPEKVTIDGHSFAPQLRGQPGQSRQWVYVQLGMRWYARNDRWKLNEAGELFDLKDAPFVEQPVPADTKDVAAQAARMSLQGVLDKLNPKAGKTDLTPVGGERNKDKAKRKRGERRRKQKPGDAA
jgi:arylsulfatase A